LAFEVGKAMLVDFGDAGQSSDVLGVLLDSRGDFVEALFRFVPALFPQVLHELKGLSQCFVPFGELLQAFVYRHVMFASIAKAGR